MNKQRLRNQLLEMPIASSQTFKRHTGIHQSRARSGLATKPNISLVRPGYLLIKRLLDIALCLAILPFLLPLILFLGLIIWLESPGPIVFTQSRTGIGGKRFKMYKLRTMVRNAHELKAEYAHLNELTWPDFKITNDPRITRIGKLLRKTSLDELPQIFNVLFGQMSWVGPRPTSFAAETYSLWHTERLEVIPGITGLWQISGRSDVDFDERLHLDVEYIEKRSIFFDLMILWKTLAVVVGKRGAY